MDDDAKLYQEIISLQKQLLNTEHFQKWLKGEDLMVKTPLPPLVVLGGVGQDFDRDYRACLYNQAQWLNDIAIRKSWLSRSLKTYLGVYQYYLDNENDITNSDILRCIENYKKYLTEEKK